MKIFIFPSPEIKHESCFCHIIKENLYPSMKTQQNKISILKGTELQIHGMFLFNLLYQIIKEKPHTSVPLRK